MVKEKNSMKIFFDLDGTLVDVLPRHYRVYSETVTAFGGKPLGKDEYWDLKRAKTLWPEILSKSGLDPNIKESFLQDFIKKIESPAYLAMDELIPGARQVLDGLYKTDELFLVSLRRNAGNLNEEVQRLELGSYFQKILSAHSETDGSDKKTELIKNELHQGKPALIVGDTEADIKTGKQLGLTTVAVLSGIRNKGFLDNLKPDYMINDIGEFTAIVQRNT